VKIKYLADEDLRLAIVLGVRRREPAISFVRALEMGLRGKDDQSLLRGAAQDGRILVSHDLRTMPQNFQRFALRAPSPGVFLIPQHLALGTAIDELVLLWAVSEAEEWKNQLRYLPL